MPVSISRRSLPRSASRQLVPMRMRLSSSGGFSFPQSVRGTTPNMAPPSRRNSPSATRVSSRSPSSIRPGSLSEDLPPCPPSAIPFRCPLRGARNDAENPLPSGRRRSLPPPGAVPPVAPVAETRARRRASSRRAHPGAGHGRPGLDREPAREPLLVGRRPLDLLRTGEGGDRPPAQGPLPGRPGDRQDGSGRARPARQGGCAGGAQPGADAQGLSGQRRRLRQGPQDGRRAPDHPYGGGG